MRRDDQAAMVRLVVSPEGVTIANNSGQSGRSGYIHSSETCLERFKRSRIKEFRSLQCRLGSDDRRAITERISKRLASESGVE
jgi:predicted RNA-binding protein YlxR (DUF448 family)